MVFKPNYRLDRAQRTRSKEAKKQEKAARREANRGADETPDETGDGLQSENPHEDQDGSELTIED